MMHVDRPRVIGRYALYDELGVGGMGSVCIGVQRDAAAPVLVAAKQLLPSHARDPRRIVMLLDEMRLTRLAQHPNVVSVRDFVYDGDRMVLVMDYVHGESLRRLLTTSRGDHVPVRIGAAIVRDVLRALDAAHDARDEQDAVIGLVHRDVTPENILVDVNGAVKLADFGVAKAEGRLVSTHADGIKGKLAYLAPEQVGGDVSPRTDIYAAGLVLWEAIVGRRANVAENDAQLLLKVLNPEVPRVRELVPDVPAALEEAIAHALAPLPGSRFASAGEFAAAIEAALGTEGLATPAEIAAWVHRLVGDKLVVRRRRIEEILSAERDRSSPTSTAALTVPASVPPTLPGRAGDPSSVERRRRRTRLIIGSVWLAAATALVVATELPSPARRMPGMAPVAPPAQASLPLVIVEPSAAPQVEPAVAATPAALPVPTAHDLNRHKKGLPPPTTLRPRCDPPYTVDAKGIVVYKNECLK